MWANVAFPICSVLFHYNRPRYVVLFSIYLLAMHMIYYTYVHICIARFP